MADVFSVQERSRVMSRIRSSGTGLEEILYAIVRESIGGRWRIDRNVSSLPGRPDIVVPTLRVAIFADGCFYHRCPTHGHIPKSNLEYWEPKLESNVRRDRRNRRKLRGIGFSVWTIWEHRLEGRRLSATRTFLGRRLTRLIDLKMKNRGK
jgi:DNA mismatch endonuclease (patch repair protein)